jgi:hypothetical protein
MKKTLLLILPGIIALSAFFLFIKKMHPSRPPALMAARLSPREDDEASEMKYLEMRAKYDFDMLRDPATGKIPAGIWEQEIAFAHTIPAKEESNFTSRGEDLNNYHPAGPNNIGGRTRGLAYDLRYNGSTNRVILGGSVSGGIMRSADGGQTWTRVSPDNDVHNVSVITQDPRAASQDTWYAGTGEPLGNSASEIGATYFGYGIFKSTNNGVSWTKLTMTNITDLPGNAAPGTALEAFDNPFDYVHKIAVNPVNGDMYVAGHRRLLRSTDGGGSFTTVFGSAVGAIAATGQMDVAITSAGKILLTVNGGNPDPTLRGVWVSTTGNIGSFTRIAGGSTLGVDSVAGWRANSYINFSGSSTPLPKRILVSLAPSNQNLAYILYENGLSNTTPDNSPEADMYKLDMTGGVNTWTNLSANMPNFGRNNPATDPFAVQGGYDMSITIKPTDPNFVILGGTSLYRSTDGFSSTANTGWIGGYSPSTTSSALFLYPNSHPDMHNFVFNPADPNSGISADDGGLQSTLDINAPGNGNVVWNMIPNYQTLQYYYVAIDPETGMNDFIGGAQDNGTQFRDKTGIIGTAVVDSNNHRRILTGDGTAVGFGKINGASQNVYGGFQLGNIRRIPLSTLVATDIRPNTLTPNPGSTGDYGEFVTNFRLDPDNTENLYYVNFNRLFRTTSASTVTPSTWTELTNVGTTIDPDGATNGFNAIRGMGFSRGPYISTHALYLGTTNGKLFRIDDPANVTSTYTPVNITPPGNTGNIQDISVNPNNDDEILVAVSNYGVVSMWWTSNAKSAAPTWKNAEGNLTLPSARSCMIIVKKDASNNPVTEYYVGTSVGLYSTVNLGTTLTAGGTPAWQREGGSVLNFAVVQSLSYRPADNTLLAGTHGNGMYYTSLGTPNFVPNPGTGINDPVTNDRHFIKNVYPTISSNIVNFVTGDIFSIHRIHIRLLNMGGQEVLRRDAAYQNGNIPISMLAKGEYILAITSEDGKYREVRKIIRF